MAVISNLVVDFTANTTKLLTGLSTAANDVRRHTAVMSGAVDGVTKSLGTLGLAFGLREMTGFIESTIKSAAALKTVADQVGLTTRDFQVLKFAATQVGVSQEDMDGGVRRLTRSIGEAVDGNKKAIDAFNELGVGVLDAGGKTRSTGDIFRDVAQALSKIKDPAARAVLEVALLGRGGQMLDPVFKGGAAAIDAAADAAQRMGDIIGPSGIDKMEAMNSKIEEMKLHFHVLATELVSYATPAITSFLDMTRQALDNIANTKFSSAPFSLIPSLTFGDTGDTFQHRGPPAGTSTGALGARNPTVGSGGVKKAAIDATAQEIEQLLNEGEQLKRTGEALELYNALIKAKTTLDTQDGQQIAELVHQNYAEKTSLKDAAEAAKAHDAELAKGLQIHESLLTPMERYNAGVALAAKLYKDGVLSLQDYSRELEVLKTNLDQTTKKTDDANARMGQLSGTIGTDLGNSLANSALNFQDWGTTVSSVLRVVLNDLLRMLDAAANASGAGGGGGWLGALLHFGLGLFTSGFGGGFGGGQSALIGGGPGGFAAGGHPPMGMASIVGESGPELFVPNQPGTIMPHDVMASLGSGRGSSNIVINAPGADAAALRRVERALASLNASLENRALAAVGNARKRGGAFAQAFGG